MIKISGKIPEHISMRIIHNDHNICSEKVSDYINNLINGERPTLDELSEEEYLRCIETDEFWQVRWYPITPISFYEVYASTLEECFMKIQQVNDD